MERSLGPGRKQVGVNQPPQMMAQRRGRQVDVGLDISRSGSLSARLNHETQNSQANWVTQSAELLSMAIDL